tara:strand:+ start:1954 stop:2481 length:528 start_codon:yes stop_codon:yes gene_type:complete
MDRYNFEEHISAYIDGELSQEEKKKFEDLIDSDSNCKEQYDKVSQLVKNLSSIPKLETNSDFRSKINSQIDEYEKSNISIFDRFKKYFLSNEGGNGFSKSSNGSIIAKPAMGLAMSCAAIVMVFYLSSNNLNSNSGIASSPSETKDEMYYSDVDSTDSDEYEHDIQLTKGVNQEE